MAHVLKQIITSRRTPGTPIGIVDYFLGSIPETLFAVVVAIGLYVSYPEMGQWFPMMSTVVNWPTTQSPLGGFVCGFMGNSFADMLGARIVKVVNG